MIRNCSSILDIIPEDNSCIILDIDMTLTFPTNPYVLAISDQKYSLMVKSNIRNNFTKINDLYKLLTTGLFLSNQNLIEKKSPNIINEWLSHGIKVFLVTALVPGTFEGKKIDIWRSSIMRSFKLSWSETSLISFSGDSYHVHDGIIYSPFKDKIALDIYNTFKPKKLYIIDDHTDNIEETISACNDLVDIEAFLYKSGITVENALSTSINEDDFIKFWKPIMDKQHMFVPYFSFDKI
jgi:hypothetical protein